VHPNFDLSPEGWATLRRLLREGLDQPPASRPGWIDALPADTADFKPRLRALLAHVGGPAAAAPFQTLPKVETGAFAEAPPNDAFEPTRAPGQTIGPYRLLRPLGEGGMATVWLAERTDMLQGRPIALKLPHRAWRHAGLAERMAREREILATLDHPNIARLYDAGVDDEGQPYLALEFVEGVRLDDYAASHAMSVPARLRLFLQVLGAVAHAHARLVVHRDLKPSNILVGADGQAKLLDFGIARLLDDGAAAAAAAAAELTQQGTRVLTPEYASPEQIGGQAIGTASDIYSLGVVLFELLTGSKPYVLQRDSRAALEEAILRAEPARPSMVADARLRKALRGDLDTIVLKALKRAPEQRYATVNAFADDIERHLDGRVVLAQPDSRAYRLRKFVARNRLTVSAVAGVMGALVVGAGVALWQAQVARAERAAALAQQARSEASLGFLQSLLQQASPDRPLTATELLDRGTKQLDQATAMDDSVLAFLRYEISTHYLRFSQADREAALLAKSAENARRAGDVDLEAAARCAAAWSLAPRERTQAKALLAEGERALAGIKAPSFDARADCLRARARVLEFEGQTDQAITLLEAGQRDLVPQGRQWNKHLLLRTQLAGLYERVDRLEEGLHIREQGLADARRRGEIGTLNEFVGMQNVATSQLRVGEARAALKTLRELATWFDRGEFPVMPMGFYGNLGIAEWMAGSPSAALSLAQTERAAAVLAGNKFQIAFDDMLTARAYVALGRAEQAVAPLEAAEAYWRTNPKGFADRLGDAALLRAEVHASTGRKGEAMAEVERVVASFGYPAVRTGRGLHHALKLSAQLLLETGDPATALERADAALAIARGLARDERQSSLVGTSLLLRAQAKAALGRAAEALADAQLAAESTANGLGPEHPKAVQALAFLKRLTAAP
jgi:serine/threonine-protein kinase